MGVCEAFLHRDMMQCATAKLTASHAAVHFAYDTYYCIQNEVDYVYE